VVNDSTLNAWACRRQARDQSRPVEELNNEGELAAVLGHEIVHAAARHGAAQIEKGELLQIGSVLVTVAAGAYGGSALGDLVGQGSAIGAQAITAKFGREDELEADKYGMKYMKAAGYDLQSAVALQELFVRKFEEGKDQDWMTVSLRHPPHGARRRKPADDGRVGRARRRSRPRAVPGGDRRPQEGRAGLRQVRRSLAAGGKRTLRARSLVNEAIKLEPRESRFYGLLGELQMVDKDYKGARPIKKASQLDPGYSPMVQAGMANYELGNRAAAQPLLDRA
jgi:predicted Zn-dependent protease